MVLRKKKGNVKKRRTSSNRPEISVPSNFEHRIHAGYDPTTGQYTGLPKQWLAILDSGWREKMDSVAVLSNSNGVESVDTDGGGGGGGGHSKAAATRRKPFCDPSHITPMQMAELKTVVRGSAHPFTGQLDMTTMSGHYAQIQPYHQSHQHPVNNAMMMQSPMSQSMVSSSPYIPPSFSRQISVARSNSLRSGGGGGAVSPSVRILEASDPTLFGFGCSTPLSGSDFQAGPPMVMMPSVDLQQHSPITTHSSSGASSARPPSFVQQSLEQYSREPTRHIVATIPANSNSNHHLSAASQTADSERRRGSTPVIRVTAPTGPRKQVLPSGTAAVLVRSPQKAGSPAGSSLVVSTAPVTTNARVVLDRRPAAEEAAAVATPPTSPSAVVERRIAVKPPNPQPPPPPPPQPSCSTDTSGSASLDDEDPSLRNTTALASIEDRATAESDRLSDEQFRAALAMVVDSCCGAQNGPFANVDENDDPRSELSDWRPIGDGSTGVVYEARQRSSGKMVAVKRMHLQRQQRRELLFNEVSVMRDYRHPNIVHMSSAHLVDDELWLVLELMDGGQLTDVVTTTRMTEPQIATVCVQVLSALAYLHAAGVIHRDVKSDSILLARDGTVKLSDLGFCGQLSADVPRRCSLVGTPYWAAAEVISKRPYDQSADVWSFGILCMEMVNGEPPYFDDPPLQAMRKIRDLEPPKLDGHPNCSPPLVSFVARALQRDPAARSTAAALLMDPFLKGAPPPSSLVELIREAQQHARQQDQPLI